MDECRAQVSMLKASVNLTMGFIFQQMLRVMMCHEDGLSLATAWVIYNKRRNQWNCVSENRRA